MEIISVKCRLRGCLIEYQSAEAQLFSSMVLQDLEKSLHEVAYQVLANEDDADVDAFLQKLAEFEEITDVSHLLHVDRRTLEARLRGNTGFKVKDLGWAKRIKSYVDEAGKTTKANGPGPNQSSRQRSRSRSKQKYRDRGSSQEKPPLLSAVEKGDANEVRRLIGAKANVDEKFQSWTPLMKASEENEVQISKILLSSRADIEATNRKNRTALSFAADPSMGRDTAPGTLRLLLEKGADCYKKDDQGETAMTRATRKGRKDALNILEEFKR